MIEILKKVRRLFDRKKKIELILLFVFTTIASVIEAYTISLLVPLSAAILKTKDIFSVTEVIIANKIFSFKASKEAMLFLCGFFIFMYIFKGIIRIAVYGYQYRFIFNAKADIQTKLVTNAIFKPYSFYASSSSSEMLRICTDDTNRAFDLISNLNGFFTEFITFIVLVINGIMINAVIAITFGVFIIVEAFAINRVFRAYIVSCSKKIQVYMATFLKCINQFFHGIKDVKVNVKEKYFIDTFNESATKSAYYFKRNNMLVSSIPVAFEVLTVLTVAVLGLVAIGMDVDFLTVIPDLVALATFGIKILQSANRFSNQYSGLNQYIASLDILIHNLENVGDLKEQINRIDPKNVKALPFSSICELKNVTFKYPTGKDEVLHDVSLQVPCGKSVGIVGASGGGKTTTVDILLGLYDPQSGGVYVDGTNIKDKNAEWLANISYVPQSIYMLDDTIKKNVAFGVREEDIDENRVIEVLKDASLFEFVNTLKNGIDEMVGENGIRLSGGQKQRIGIARALYKNPKLIVFDEATSALDNDTEKEIMKTIDSLQGTRTIIIIAHRLTTIENCDIVYKVENKKIEKTR